MYVTGLHPQQVAAIEDYFDTVEKVIPVRLPLAKLAKLTIRLAIAHERSSYIRQAITMAGHMKDSYGFGNDNPYWPPPEIINAYLYSAISQMQDPGYPHQNRGWW